MVVLCEFKFSARRTKEMVLLQEGGQWGLSQSV